MMFLVEATEFCEKTQSVWKLAGKLLFIFKIVIPLLVIIFGMVDFGKAVVASKDDEIKKAGKQVLVRVLAGIVIFFIPNLIGFAFSLADNFSESNYEGCVTCLTDPGKC